MNEKQVDLEVPLEESVEEPSCRICLEAGGNLIQPCDCSGSAAFVHKECLVKWLNISKRANCEICLYEYNIEEENVKNSCMTIFSEDLSLNIHIPLFGLFVLVPMSPVCYFLGVHALDVYFAMNIFFAFISIAVIQKVIILPTLTFWKLCLTVGDTIVSLQTQFYDYIIFDWGIVIFFCLVTFVCYRNNGHINIVI